MKIKAHHLSRTHGHNHSNRRRSAGRHVARRHYSVPVGNRSDALHYLEELFGVNDTALSPDAIIY